MTQGDEGSPDKQAPEQTYVQMPDQVLMPALMSVALGGGPVPSIPGALVLDAVPGCPRPEVDPEVDEACNATLLDKTDAGYRQHHCNHTKSTHEVWFAHSHVCVCGKDWNEVTSP